MRLSVLVLALGLIAACTNDDKTPPRPIAGDRARADEAPPPRPPIVALASVDPALARPVTSTKLIVIAREGALSIATAGTVGPAGIDLRAVRGEPVAAPGDLVAKLAEEPKPAPVVASDGGVIGVLADSNLTTSITDADVYGGLLGTEDGEMQGGFGYGLTDVPPKVPAGLHGQPLGTDDVVDAPLVLVDAAAPATRLIEVLSALPSSSRVAITTDGGTHAQTLGVELEFFAGTAPDKDVDLTALYAGSVRVPVPPGTTAGALIASLAAALTAGGTELWIGDALVRPKGWGTIGTGRYGTIGHGSGTGEGYGVGRGRGGMRGRDSAAVASVRIGQPSGSGDLDKAIIRRYIKRNLPKIKDCYEKQRLLKPGLQGTVNTAFTIAPTGVVLDAKAKGIDAKLASCIAGVIKGIEFPKPKGGGNVVITSYPFEFRPTGG